MRHNCALSEVSYPYLFSLLVYTTYVSGHERALITAILVIVFVIVECLGREQQYAIAKLGIPGKNQIRWSF